MADEYPYVTVRVRSEMNYVRILASAAEILADLHGFNSTQQHEIGSLKGMEEEYL